MKAFLLMAFLLLLSNCRILPYDEKKIIIIIIIIKIEYSSIASDGFDARASISLESDSKIRSPSIDWQSL